MEIKFSSSTIKSRCNKEKEMLLAYGKACADLLKKRLLQLFAAEFLGVFSPSGSKPLMCVPHSGDDLKFFQLPLNDNYIMLFEAVNGEMLNDSSGLDWDSIKTIIIHGIENDS